MNPMQLFHNEIMRDQAISQLLSDIVRISINSNLVPIEENTMIESEEETDTDTDTDTDTESEEEEEEAEHIFVPIPIDSTIELHLEYFIPSRPISFYLLTSSDIREIASENELDINMITIELYNICPEFFASKSNKIFLSQYPNLNYNHFMKWVNRDYNVKYCSLDEIFNIIQENLKTNPKKVIPLLIEIGIITSTLPISETIKIIIDHEYKFPVKIPTRLIERINKINTLDLIIKSHIITYMGELEMFYRESIPNEDILLNITVDNVKEYANIIGMLIPLTHVNDALRYYLTNFNDYKNIRQNSKILSRKTDIYIFSSYNIYTGYTSRRHLLAKIEYFIRGKEQIVFTAQKKSLLDKAKNKTITTLESLQELIKSKERIICVGNIKEFDCFICSELILLWSSISKDFNAKHLLPYDLEREMNENIYEELCLLLRCYGMTAELEQINNLWNEIKASKIQLLNGEERRIEIFKYFSIEEKQEANRFFILLFECGMYLRRWKGKGFPFPLEEKHTKNKKIDPDVNATPHLNEIKDIFKSKNRLSKWLKDIPIVNNNGNYEITLERLYPYFDSVYNDNECIRMASSKFICTADRSLKVYLNKNIEGFDYKHVSKIT